MASAANELEAQLQAAHRQTAPFRCRESMKKPAGQQKRPGRPAGHAGVHRAPPTEVDATLEAPLKNCPHCQRRVTGVTPRVQFIEEWSEVRPLRVKLTKYTGVCTRCGEVFSTCPLQTSPATGAAGTHLGPRAQALAVSLVHDSGLSLQKTCDTLRPSAD